MATEIYESLHPKSEYFDKTRKLSPEEYFKRLAQSSTLYVGNLSIYTREEAIYELFSRCGQIKLFKIGLNKLNNTPCGFCFIEYNTREEAEYAIDCVSRTYLDDRIIRCDWDIGFEEGRQYGRGKSGGQVRDEFRTYEDPGRGELIKKKDENYQNRERDDRGNYRRDNNYRGGRGGHRGNYRGNYDNRDRSRQDYRHHDRNDRHYDRNDRSERNDRNERNESYNNQRNNDSDSDQEDNYRRKKTKAD